MSDAWQPHLRREDNMVRGIWPTMTVALACLALATASHAGVIFSDDFQRSELGPNWRVVDDPAPASGPSDWRISDGALVQRSNIYRSDKEYEFWQGTHAVAGSADWTDYELTASVTSGDDDGWGLIVRYKDGGNFYRFITVADGGNGGPFRRLEKFVDGKRTVLAEEKQAFELGKPYEVKFRVFEGSLELWLNGEKRLTASDKTFTAGKVGFLAYADSSLAIRKVVVTGEDTPSSVTGPDLLFGDDFAGSALRPEWKVIDDAPGSSHWFVSDGSLHQDSNIYRGEGEYAWYQGTHAVAGEGDWGDYELTAKVKSTDDDGWGVIVRYKNPSHYYRFITVADGGNGGPFMRLEKFAGDKPVVLAEERKAFEPGKEYAVKFTAVDDKLEVWLAGQKVLTATDTDLGFGKAGFLCYANSGLNVWQVRVKAIR